nr:energy transducer TonB [Cytophagales bacterium]
MEKEPALHLCCEYRNKAYGAYQLRQAYDQYLRRATFVGCAGFLVFLAFLWYSFRYAPEAVVPLIETIAEPTVIGEPPPPPVPTPPPPTVRTAPPATIDYREMVVAHEEEIDPNGNPTRVEETEGRAIANITVDGPESMENAPFEFSENTGGTGFLEEEKKEDILITAEQMPEFEGGLAALGKYLSKHLRYPAAARSRGVSGLVYVQFVVNSQGQVSDVKVL